MGNEKQLNYILKPLFNLIKLIIIIVQKSSILRFYMLLLVRNKE